MQPFPVINSTVSPAYLSIWVAENYDLTEVQCRLLKTNMNHTYMVEAAEGKFVLRIYIHKYRNLQLVKDEIDILKHLKEKNSPISYPVINKDGKFINEILAPEGIRYATVFSYAEGNKQRFITAEASREIGIQVARMHLALADSKTRRICYGSEILIDEAYKKLMKFFPPDMEEMQLIKACGHTFDNVFNSVELQKGTVHLDIWYDNMSITDDGEITLFDFDNCGYGWLILDIGYYCMQLYHIETDKRIYEEKKRSFLEGYRSITDITDDEVRLLPQAGAAIWIYYLGIHAERFDTFSNNFLSANFVKMFIGKMKDWLVYNEVDIEKMLT